MSDASNLVVSNPSTAQVMQLIRIDEAGIALGKSFTANHKNLPLM